MMHSAIVADFCCSRGAFSGRSSLFLQRRTLLSLRAILHIDIDDLYALELARTSMREVDILEMLGLTEGAVSLFEAWRCVAGLQFLQYER